MAAGKGGKHNKAHSSLECNVLGQKTEYRYQRPDLLERRGGKNCPHNVENRSTGHLKQVIYSDAALLNLFSFLSEPGASSGHCQCNRGGWGSAFSEWCQLEA